MNRPQIIQPRSPADFPIFPVPAKIEFLQYSKQLSIRSISPKLVHGNEGEPPPLKLAHRGSLFEEGEIFRLAPRQNSPEVPRAHDVLSIKRNVLYRRPLLKSGGSRQPRRKNKRQKGEDLNKDQAAGARGYLMRNFIPGG